MSCSYPEICRNRIVQNSKSGGLIFPALPNLVSNTRGVVRSGLVVARFTRLTLAVRFNILFRNSLRLPTCQILFDLISKSLPLLHGDLGHTIRSHWCKFGRKMGDRGHAMNLMRTMHERKMRSTKAESESSKKV
jgi:hypothetical protein